MPSEDLLPDSSNSCMDPWWASYVSGSVRSPLLIANCAMTFGGVYNGENLDVPESAFFFFQTLTQKALSLLWNMFNNRIRDYQPVHGDLEDPKVPHEFRWLHRRCSQPSIAFSLCLLAGLLSVSVTLNALFLLKWANSVSCATRYAGLKLNVVDRVIGPDPAFVDENLTISNQAWATLSGDPGVVALRKSWIASKGLPETYPFPWDHSKGVFLLQGYHNLHCLRTIFNSLYDYQNGLPQRIEFHHTLHCLEELRQDVICNANDLPRYASYDPPGTGQGQIRKCRDWRQLEVWAKKHTACFKHVDGIEDRLENRFKFCPED